MPPPPLAPSADEAAPPSPKPKSLGVLPGRLPARNDTISDRHDDEVRFTVVGCDKLLRARRHWFRPDEPHTRTGCFLPDHAGVPRSILIPDVGRRNLRDVISAGRCAPDAWTRCGPIDRAPPAGELTSGRSGMRDLNRRRDLLLISRLSPNGERESSYCLAWPT